MKTEERSAGDKFAEFLQRNRKPLFITMGAVIFLLIGMIVFFTVSNNYQQKAISEVEELLEKYAELSVGFPDDEKLDELIVELKEFAGRRSGYAGGRAWATIGDIYSQRQDWVQAEDAWFNAAKTASGTYLAPIAYFNAAAAAEEQGKLIRAIELLENSISHRFEFAGSPRAQFSIGRINEKLGNIPEAMEAYRQITIRWPAITFWANLAQSRIIALEIR